MITVVAGGDSFIWGSELHDCGPVTPSKKTFAALLAQGMDYRCVAWPGASNDSISRNVINACCQSKPSLVLVSWTFPGRYEFRFSYDTGQRHSPWYSITPWTIKTNLNDIKSEFVNNNEIIFATQVANIQQARKTGVAEFANSFYSHVGGSEYWEIYSSLKEIVYLQNYLKLNNIPYLFTCADSSIWYNHTIQQGDVTIKGLANQVDQDCWFWFPASNKPGDTQNPRGFYQWAVENKYPIGTTHPLEQAHEDAAELIKEKFNEVVKKHLEQNRSGNSLS